VMFDPIDYINAGQRGRAAMYGLTVISG
jgi:hypothetical protein